MWSVLIYERTRLCKKYLSLPHNLIQETMKKTKKQKETEENEVVPEEKKSKIRLYWEDRDRRGIPEGQILNMRAVLK